jgi:hypothetical protein
MAQVPAKKQFTYRFNIKGSPEIDHFDGLVATYKGRWLRLSSGWCLFNDDQEIITLNVVVLGQAPSIDNIGNTITGFSITDTTQARWFRITRRTMFEGEKIKYFWDINEVTSKKTSNKIPKNAFVIYLDPDFVENLQCGQQNSLERNIVALPTLILKSSVTQEDFDNALGECACGAIEARTVHTPPMYQENRDAQTITLLPIS